MLREFLGNADYLMRAGSLETRLVNAREFLHELLRELARILGTIIAQDLKEL